MIINLLKQIYMRLEEANILELKNYRETKLADTVSMSYLSIYFPIVFFLPSVYSLFYSIDKWFPFVRD